MLQSDYIVLGLYKWLSWVAQTPTIDITPSGPRLFITIISGVILAFAIQLVLTNLSVAGGISYLGHQPDSDSGDHNGGGSFGGTLRKISVLVGMWTVITVTIALTIASFLAVKLSLPILSWLTGAVLGLVIWGAYFLLLVWVSSTAVGSFIGSIVNTATSGFQALMGTATAALGAKAVSQQVVATAEAAASAVSRELGSAIDPGRIRDNVEDYIEMLRPPELDISRMRSEFEKLLNDPQLKEIAGSSDLRNIDRQKFVELVSSRTDLSKRDINRITDTLYGVWQQVVNQQQPLQDHFGELIDYLKSLQPGKTRVDELSRKIDQLIAQINSQKQPDQKPAPGGVQQTLQQSISALTGIVLGRADLSDLDVEKILGVLSSAKNKAVDTVSSLQPASSQTYSPIRIDVENYLHTTYAWQLNQARISEEFRDVIYDPAAAPGTVRRELEQLSRNDFVNILQQRGLLTQREIQRVADQLEAVRKEVLITVTAEEEREISQDLQRRIESYLLVNTKSDLTPEGIAHSFKPLLEDPEADYETMSRRLSLLNRQELRETLLERNDIYPDEADRILDELEKQKDKVLVESKGLAEQAKYQAETLWLNLESYLRNTGKEELNPDTIRAELKTLLKDPQAGVAAIRTHLSRFDRDTLVQLLSQRQDLSEEQVNQILDAVEHSWYSIRHVPQVVADKAKDQYDSVTTTIADYLRNTGKTELNPEGIQRDIARLFDNPKEGALALSHRLSQVDRDTLVKLLSQRQDLSEEQVNEIINSVQTSIRNTVRAPRRLAVRTQQRLQTFQDYLQEYLRQTGKEELNPEGIKRDLQLLLHDPRTGVESLGDRLSHFDRSTIIALLKIREDMTEEEAARIADNIVSVREQFVDQVRAIQRRIQDVVEGVFARIRNYLNSLDRPELNYDGIKRDVRQLFDDPHAGFDALRDRLSAFNRDTLVAIMSSREDISEADANRIIDQIERSRNSVLQRAERIQQEAQRRLEEVKIQAQRQAEETRKTAASAAWWLFTTAIVSAIFAAFGGAMAVVIV
ncbi:MFS transporter [Aetokthonos hydrillicola Thurmond2011]|jgi:nucleoid DNA-binding protein|uniref:MFS transporter n=1 Tax=Aetokthonos hydrillicola Thurmond2011 TaxID=2712845 RepID=A0AAP5I8U8_9CYAN|nr:MFS transporter [Aetokthonos hydrillicola]MBO3461884.1 MFS transporter [Aetokthonos hydrillicola CCALA 1050]MBW4586774.1 MFS transporter [Aetokthonos hydrillicola CCALA 1050]MDR9895869.1 MFS transporter [Aetokthonos hydrillicola Thurmond2011]